MTRLAEIAVRIEGAGASGGLGSGTLAVINEIAALLDRLVATGQPAAIDLRSLPLGPSDREQLQAALGRGEVQATLEADGPSQIRETDIPGVWWIEHRNVRDEVVAEMIEITSIPEILTVAADELGRGAQALRARIAQGGQGASLKEAI